MMTLEEIKAAVDAGKVVYQHSSLYVVIKDSLGRYLIDCPSTGMLVGLTWRDGVTMNGKPEEFFLAYPEKPQVYILCSWVDRDLQSFEFTIEGAFSSYSTAHAKKRELQRARQDRVFFIQEEELKGEEYRPW